MYMHNDTRFGFYKIASPFRRPDFARAAPTTVEKKWFFLAVELYGNMTVVFF